MFSPIFERFVQASPVTVMVNVLPPETDGSCVDCVKAMMERIFSADRLDDLFEATAQRQYTRELLFSTVVNLMSLVVCNIRPSVNAAYKAFEKQIGVSRVAFYSKRGRHGTASLSSLSAIYS